MKIVSNLEQVINNFEKKQTSKEALNLYNKAVKKYGVENVKSKGNRLMPIEERHSSKYTFAIPGTGSVKYY